MATKLATLGPGSLLIGEVGAAQEFAIDITKAELSPEFDNEDPIHYLSGDVDHGEDGETANLTGEIRQDYGSFSSLLVWCKKNSGAIMPFTFIPLTTGALEITGTLKVRSVTIGGDVKEKNRSTFEFPVLEWDIAEHTPAVG